MRMSAWQRVLNIAKGLFGLELSAVADPTLTPWQRDDRKDEENGKRWNQTKVVVKDIENDFPTDVNII